MKTIRNESKKEQELSNNSASSKHSDNEEDKYNEIEDILNTNCRSNIKCTGGRGRSFSNAESFALHDKNVVKNITIEELIEKKHEIAEKVDSFLIKSKMFSMGEMNSGDEEKMFETNERHSAIQRKSQLKGMKKYAGCKAQEKELSQLDEESINFDLIFARRGELKTSPSYSINYSKYMTNPEEFKAEELAKKRIYNCNYEEFLLLQKSLKNKLCNIPNSTAIDLVVSIFPQLGHIIESQIELSAAFSYLTHNWKQIVLSSSHSKLIKSNKVPSLVLALLKESNNISNASETQYEGTVQVFLEGEIDFDEERDRASERTAFRNRSKNERRSTQALTKKTNRH